MVPLFFSDDVLRVERCAESDLRRGDVAVLLAPDQRLIAHLVVATEPVRTSSLLGTRDEQPLEPLGRVIAARRGPLVLPLPKSAAPLIALSHRLLASPAVHRLARRAREWRSSNASAPARRALLGPVRIERLAGDRLARAIAFIADSLGANAAAAFAETASHGVAFGASARAGRIVCVAAAAGGVLKSAHARWSARGLSLEARVLEALGPVERAAPQLDEAWHQAVRERSGR